VRYVLDPSQGRFTVRAFSGGMLSVLGHNPTFAIRDYGGELRFAPDAPAEAAILITVKADSLTVTDPVSPKDREEIERRMREEVLETAKYPEVVYRSIEIQADRIADDWYRLRISGELSLHGVKKTHPVEAQLRLLGDEMRLSGQCTLSHSAYRIKPVTALGGTIKLKDELKFDFEIVGQKRDE
jgi:polyisoprenoid-binding protein YceI